MRARGGADEELESWLADARRGVGAGFTGLYRCLAGQVAGYVRGRGVSDVDDVVNDVFLGAFQSLDAFDGDGPRFRALVFSIAWNKTADWHRRQARRAERPARSDELSMVARDNPEAEAIDASARERVEELLGPLTSDQRNVLLLRIVGDLSLEETARAMGKPVGAIKALQHRALAAIRRNLEEPVSTEAASTTTGSR